MSNMVKDPDAFGTFARQQLENSKWERDLRIDAELSKGISQGLKFSEFQQISGCPSHLRNRYDTLTEQARRAEEAKNDGFLQGFMSENGSYIPRDFKR